MITRRELLAIAAVNAIPVKLTPPSKCIDSHVHVWSSQPDDLARFPFAAGANVPSGLNADVEGLLARMNANGVSRTVLIQVIHYRWDNRYLVNCLRRFPKSFAGVCRVNPEDPEAPDHLAHWTEQGCHGVRLSPAAGAEGDWFRGPLMPPLWRRCEASGVPMTLLLPASRLPDLRPLLNRFPGVTTVVDHMADVSPDNAKGIADLLSLARYPRLFVKVTHPWTLSRESYPFRDTWPLLQRVRDAFGSARLMGGTDWPIKTESCSYEQRLALYRQGLPFFNAAEREDLLVNTAQRLWPSLR
jgi:L-fuconolactonase